MLLYSDNPFDATNPLCQDGNYPNGISDGEINGGLSHEHNESITDPLPNDAWTNGVGADHGEEVGDQCVGQMGTTLGTAPNGAKYNQVIDGHFYWYQEDGAIRPIRACSGLRQPGTAAREVHGHRGLRADPELRRPRLERAGRRCCQYVWQFNDVFGADTIEQTTPTISHTFPSAGAYSVGLTIMGKDGTSTGNGGIVTTGQSGIAPASSSGRSTRRPDSQ